MNGLDKFFPKKQREILQNPNSSEAKTFFEGMRLAIDMINDANPEEQKKILSTTNRSHLIACMGRFAEKQSQCQYDDALELLKIYDYNKAELEAFLFNVSKISTTTGQALDANGQPLDGKTASYWPHCEITLLENPKQTITCEEYYALSPEERAKYKYERCFYLEKNGVRTLKVVHNDRTMVKALIHNLLEIDGDVEWLRERLMQTYGWEYIPLRDANNNLIDERERPEMFRRAIEKIDQMLQRSINCDPPTGNSRLDTFQQCITEEDRDPCLAISEKGQELLHQLTTIHCIDTDHRWRWGLAYIDVDAFCGVIEAYNYSSYVCACTGPFNNPVRLERLMSLGHWITLGDLLVYAGTSNKYPIVAAIPNCDMDNCYQYFDSVMQDVLTNLGKMLMHMSHAILDNGTAAPLAEAEKVAAKKLANALIKIGHIRADSVFAILE